MGLDLTWVELLDKLKNATEEECAAMMNKERSGKARTNYLLRIYSRYSKVRAERERRELFSSEVTA